MAHTDQTQSIDRPLSDGGQRDKSFHGSFFGRLTVGELRDALAGLPASMSVVEENARGAVSPWVGFRVIHFDETGDDALAFSAP